ncbi:sensor histidine kinase [Joostella sp.]|uniref:sensor histidine kinase n=1 Tax=Joostella sp. TaxID=2231138 RepID=UPI003A94EB0F
MSKENKIGLIQKTSGIFIISSIVLMSLSAVLLYFYVRSILREEIEEELYSTTARIEHLLAQGAAPFSLPPVVEVNSTPILSKETIKDTLIFDPSQNEDEVFRELTSFKEIKGINYKIVVRDLVVESEGILIAIIVSYIVIILLVFIILFYFNRVGNSYLWKPFFSTLQEIKKFSITNREVIMLESTDIKEFSELNYQIEELTGKVRADYNNLKQFTEDVSHELQTPLSIMQVKVDNIINGDPLSDEQYTQLTSIQRDIKRVTQMNRGLTLLTKIENNQFLNAKEISIAFLIEESLKNFKEISPQVIQYNKEDELLVTMDLYLAQILCNNLISNAIKHNSGVGEIIIETKSNSLFISNQGTNSILNADQIFNRFYRENESIKSTGLGLAIVKKICDLYNFKVSYHFRSGLHVFSVNFFN